MDRYSFTVRLLHSHHLVGLSRRTGAKATFAASGGDRLARGRRRRNIICQTQTLAPRSPLPQLLAVAGINLMAIPIVLICALFAGSYVRGLTAAMIEGA